jgi:hypothetical protein
VISLPFGRLGRRGVLVLAGGATGIVLVGGGVAWAYWDTTASVPTYAFADSVNAGGAPTAGANNGSINLSWPASTTVAGHAVGGYLVNRYASASGGTATPAAQGTCAANPVSATDCTETNLPAGTWYYTVTPVLGAWHGTESPRSNGISTADTFTLSLSSGVTAGTSSTLTIAAKAGSQTDAGYTGARTLAFSGPGTAPDGTHAPSYPTNPITFTNGVATVPITLYKAETTTLSVADGTVTGSTGVTVGPAAAGQFALGAPSSPTAGAARSVTLTAQDAYQNRATTYTGAKTLTWSGPGTAPDGTDTPTYPANPVTFSAGAATVTITLVRAESPTLNAGDGTISGTSGTFTVNAGAPAHLAWTHVTLSRGASLGSPCFFTCSATNLNNGGTFTAHLSVTDAEGNAVSGLASSETITIGTNGGSVSPTSVTVPAGSTESGPFTFTAQSGNWTSDTVTATSTHYGSITATLAK